MIYIVIALILVSDSSPERHSTAARPVRSPLLLHAARGRAHAAAEPKRPGLGPRRAAVVPSRRRRRRNQQFGVCAAKRSGRGAMRDQAALHRGACLNYYLYYGVVVFCGVNV